MTLYYILYPNKKCSKKVMVTKHKPDPKTHRKCYGFAEGPLKNLKEVKHRLNWMNVPDNKRPKKLRYND